MDLGLSLTGIKPGTASTPNATRLAIGERLSLCGRFGINASVSTAELRAGHLRAWSSRGLLDDGLSSDLTAMQPPLRNAVPLQHPGSIPSLLDARIQAQAPQDKDCVSPTRVPCLHVCCLASCCLQGHWRELPIEQQVAQPHEFVAVMPDGRPSPQGPARS